MNKDNHLIYESLVQSRAPVSDEQAAKMIADKIKGTPNLNMHNIKMYVQRYMGLVGKAPSDVDFVAAMVHDNLQNMGMGENAENAQQFTVVSGGVDNTSEEGIDINPADHIHAHSLKDAAEETLGEMQGDEDFDDTFPEEYREYVKDIFMMSNDSGDFIAILPGHLNEDQIFTKLVDVRDNSENAESADEKKERTQRKWQMNKDRWAKWKMENPEAAAKHAAKKMGKSENAEHVPLTLGEPDPALKNTGAGENAENEPHGYPQGMTAIQNLLLNELKKKGFALTKISHADKDRDAYPTVFMHKQSGPMHTVAEIDGMGAINGEHYKDYMANLEDGSEDAEGRSNA